MRIVRLCSGSTLAVLLCFQAGCNGRGPQSAPRFGNTHGTTPPKAATADLSRPFGYQEWSQVGGRTDPLSVGRALARVAGGTWVILASKPLDDLKWSPEWATHDYSQPSTTVLSSLEAIKKSGADVSWEGRKGYVLLYFGPVKELEALRPQPPAEIMGICICSDNGEALLNAVSDLGHVPIQGDRALLALRGTLATARKLPAEEDEPKSITAIISGSSYSYGGAQEAGRSALPFEFKLVERMTFNEFLTKLGTYLGGECREAGGKWEIRPITDPQKITAEIERLKTTLEQNTGNPADWGSSYSSRQSGGGGEEISLQELPALREEELSALESLAMFGKPAVPALAGFLTMEKAPLAQATMRMLSQMRLPESAAALSDFGRKLNGAQEPQHKAIAGLLLTELIYIFASDLSKPNASFLSGVATDPNTSARARAASRMALVRAGHLTPFQTTGHGKAWAPADLSFMLADAAPAEAKSSTPTPQPPGMITPLSSARTSDGDEWAVFVSGRLGAPEDLWLARRRGGPWEEFLFTGRQFERDQNYGYETPKPGTCVIQVSGDQITLRPPDPKLAAEVARLQKAIQKPSGSPQAQQALYRRYSELSQKSAASFQKTVKFSQQTLRKDTDGDRVTDIMEARLGTDAAKADTDGDRSPDGSDQNPLARSSPGVDRVQMLQAVFTALYGADTSPEPILVVIERPYWQAFDGSGARVLCVSREEFLRRSQELTTLRALEFGGPTTADDTVLRSDGPCLLSDSRNRAEVHFWQWNAPTGRRTEESYRYSAGRAGKTPVEYVARFERKGDWKVVSIKPWRFRTADRATAEYMDRSRNGMGGYR
jgi:hypothetical protein